MSKGVKIAIGVVAAVAIPFVAPAIGGMIAASTGISAALASTAVGAALGGAAGYATGGARGALTGAALGGFGGFAGSGGFGQMFGGTAAGTTAGTVAGTGTGALPGLTAGSTAAAGLPTAGGLTTAATAAPGVFSSLTNSIIQNAPNALVQLSLLAFNKPPQDLNEAQQRLLTQMQEEAKTNRELFTQRLELAQNMVRQGQSPDLAGAYANAIVPVQRAFRDEERQLLARGGSPEAAAALRRAGIIETAGRAPRATAAASEEGRRMITAGGALMPTQAPVDKTAATEVAIEERKKAEEDKRLEQMSRIAGGLFGGPSFGQNRYGGKNQPTPDTTPSQPQRTAGLTTPMTSYSDIYNFESNYGA